MSNIVSFNDMQQMAEAIAKSGLFGMKDTNSVLALMAVAQAEGLHPATAARDFHIIQGRPALKADAMLARFQNAGGQVNWKEYTDERVTGCFKHPNGGELDVTWTIEQATRIGLVKPGSGWQKFPRAMLRSRCISEGIRSVFPGSVTGFYSPEEVADFEPRSDSRGIKDIPVEQLPQSVNATIYAGDTAINLVDMKEDLIDILPLYVPGQTEPYAKYFNEDDWIQGYVDMVKRISQSAKLSFEDKVVRNNDLKEVNKEVTGNFSSIYVAKLLGSIEILRKELANG